jgi:hypothetical protein
MKFCKFITLSMVSSFLMGGVLGPALAANPDMHTLRKEARAELSSVTLDVDKADVLFSRADGLGSPSLEKVAQYRTEYLAGVQSFLDGKYADALKHLRNADKIIRSQPDWAETK